MCGVLCVKRCGGGQVVGVGPVREEEGYMVICFIILVFFIILLLFRYSPYY